MTGFGRVSYERMWPMPSWERITAVLSGFSILAAAYCIGLRQWRRAAVWSIVCGLTTALVFVNAETFRNFREVLLLHEFPLMLPCDWPRLVATHDGITIWPALFAIASCATLRRGFERTDWVLLPLELTLYAALLQRNKLSRALPALAAVSLIIGAFAYWQFGVGPLTGSNRNRVWANTGKGRVNWSESDARLYQRLRSSLSDRPGPLMAFLYSGGFNFYLDRSNPSPSDEGLVFLGRDPEAAVTAIRAAKPTLLYTDYYSRIKTVSGASLTSWKLIRSFDSRLPVEQPLFDRISDGCEKSPVEHTEPQFWIYRCR